MFHHKVSEFLVKRFGKLKSEKLGFLARGFYTFLKTIFACKIVPLNSSCVVF